jgi:hypothetical protein
LSSDSSASRFIQSLNQPRRLLSKTILATMLDARRNLGVSNYLVAEKQKRLQKISAINRSS